VLNSLLINLFQLMYLSLFFINMNSLITDLVHSYLLKYVVYLCHAFYNIIFIAFLNYLKMNYILLIYGSNIFRSIYFFDI
jgi:hypothetical protein